MWIYALIPIGVALIAFVYFVFHMIFWEIQPVASGIAVDLGTNSSQYTLVDAFFQAFDYWAVILALIALFVMVVVMAQRRGPEA